MINIIPLNYRLFHLVGIFKHAPRVDYDYSLFIWDKHFNDVKFYLKDKNNCLELGPGLSLYSSYFAEKEGFKKIYYIDKEKIAKIEKNLQIDQEYLVNGLNSLFSIKKSSINYVFSNSVLQYVSDKEIDQFIFQLRKISSYGCIHSHEIDFLDMVDRSRNSLCKINPRLRFYTNRIKKEEWIELFELNNFEILKIVVKDDIKNFNAKFILKCI